MDKKTLLAIFLMGLVLLGYSLWMGTNTKPVENLKSDTIQTELKDSTQNINTNNNTATEKTQAIDTSIPKDSLFNFSKYGVYFTQFAEGNEDKITIENNLFKAIFSSKGAVLEKFFLKKYNKWDGEQSQLFWKGDKQLYNEFLTTDGKRIDTRDLFFDLNLDKKNYSISDKDSLVLKAYIKWDNTKFIEKTFTFYGDDYKFHLSQRMVNLDNIIKNQYNLSFDNGLRYQEKNTIDESTDAQGVVVVGEDFTEVNADDPEEPTNYSITGNISYAGIKNKYFTSVIQPQNMEATISIDGTNQVLENSGVLEKYNLTIKIPYNGGDQTDHFNVYIGPIETKRLENLGYSRVINYGWWIFRYIGQAFVQFFLFINQFINNWGITIIVFSIILKFILYPLSRPQMRSMEKMKVLSPEIQKIRDKHPDDMTKQQQETMQLYSQYGVNPFGGCLPLLLQMPILYTLWAVFRTNVNLRQTSFLPGWIDDLSVADTIFNFGFSFLGISSISGLALAMGITMFFQQKMSITDPRQKSMVYIMPIMFTFMFSGFPAGLNLYYFTFNLISILQQVYITNFAKNKITLESMKKTPKKEGWFARKMKEAQAMAEAQKAGKPLPGNMNKYQHTPKRRDTKSNKKK